MNILKRSLSTQSLVQLIFTIFVFSIVIIYLFKMVFTGLGVGRLSCKLGYAIVSPFTVVWTTSGENPFSHSLYDLILSMTCPPVYVHIDLNDKYGFKRFLYRLYYERMINKTLLNNALNNLKKGVDYKQCYYDLVLGYYITRTIGESLRVKTDYPKIHYIINFISKDNIEYSEYGINIVLSKILYAKDGKTHIMPNYISNNVLLEPNRKDDSCLRFFGLSNSKVLKEEWGSEDKIGSGEDLKTKPYNVVIYWTGASGLLQISCACVTNFNKYDLVLCPGP